MFILIILVIGFSGIAAQVLLLREFLVVFYGNELTLGVILANWLMAEAIGVLFAGKIIDRIKNKLNFFILLEIVFSLMLPISIYLSRTFKGLLGLSFGESMGLYPIFLFSFLIILPVAFSHGALFSAGCKVSSIFAFKNIALSIGKVYSWETIGTIVGGAVLTYLFIPFLHSFQIAFIVSIFNLAILFLFLKYIPRKRTRYILLSCIILISFLFFSFSPDYLHRLSINKQWKGQKVLAYRNSVYGNVVVTRKEGQYTFFYNGSPIITTPYPDITFVEEFAHLPLLFHPHPKDILIISGGAGGLINEARKHALKKIDYAELDPLIISMLKDYSSDLTRREISDARVDIINLDGRFFLMTTRNKYDVIMIGLSSPSDLSTNRLFTQEFFSLAKDKLNPDGILALRLPGSLAYLSNELKSLNASILNGLKNTYNYVRVIPGDDNIFLASSSTDITDVSADLINSRMSERGIETRILIPSYIEYRLNEIWLDWFKDSLRGATKRVNHDLAPFAVFETLVSWNRKFSPGFANILEFLGNLNLMGAIIILIFIITLALFCVFRLRPKSARLNIAYSIATTGLFGMLMNLVLIFSFQVFYGYLYHQIGILISMLMAGIVLGSFLMTRRLDNIKQGLSLFVKLEISIAVFSCLAALIITILFHFAHYSSLFFISLFFLSGFFIGLEFPLAGKIYLGQNRQIGETSGLVYGADLLGGWVGGILGGIILLPLLGLFNTCMVIAIFKLSSLFLLLLFRDSVN